MTYPHQIPERDELLSKAESICSILEHDADQSEADRTLAKTSVEALSDAGLMSMCLPRSLGGVEADPITQSEVFEVLSEANGAGGWCCLIGATAAGMVGGMIGEAALPEVFKAGQTAFVAGSAAPSGLAERVDGGYRVTGRWAFGSGIHHANWISTIARVTNNGETVRHANGAPQLCNICLPVKDVIIEDNWFSNGLCGTGSSHYRIEDAFVADDFTLKGSPPPRGGALFRLPIIAYVAACHVGFALGVARRSMKEIIAIADNKKRTLSGKAIADRGAFHKELGVISCKLAGARAYSFEILNEVWEATCNDESLSLIKWGECRAATTYVTEVAAEVASFAYRYGAGAALYRSHPLQRCLRDIETATQHGVVSDENYESLGLALIGKGQWDPMIGRPPAK